MRFHSRICAIVALIFGIGIGGTSGAKADGRFSIDQLPESNFTAQILKDADGVDHAYLFEPGKPRQDLGPVYTIPAGTTMYHWGKTQETTGMLAHSDAFDVGNMNYRMMHPDHGGGGLYLSRDRADSSDYGPRCVYYSLPRDAKVLHMAESQYLMGELSFAFDDQSGETARMELALRAIGIDGFREDLDYEWYVVFSPELLVNPHRLEVKTAMDGMSEASQTIRLLVKFDQDGDDMTEMPSERWPELYDLFVKHHVTAQEKSRLLKDLIGAYWDDKSATPTYPVRTLRSLAKRIPHNN